LSKEIGPTGKNALKDPVSSRTLKSGFKLDININMSGKAKKIARETAAKFLKMPTSTFISLPTF
jgi:hypothetical protein